MSKIPAKHTTSSPSKIVFRSRRGATNVQQRYSLQIGDRVATNSQQSNSLKIGDRVIINGKSGTIAFIGSTNIAEGEWIGINLDEPQGKNDGSHGGIRYFETDANHGLFCRPDKVQHLSLNGAPQTGSLRHSLRLSSIEDVSNNVLGITSIDELDLSSTKNLQIGDQVIIRGTKLGTLKYIGQIHMDEGIWCGIELDGPFGKHDGKIDGKRYFRCPHRFGLFAPLRHVKKVVVDPDDSEVFNRQSIISTDSNTQCPDSPSQYSHFTEFSTSSDSLNEVPLRSSKKIKQLNLSADLTTIETSLSSQITQLLETIKEKDLFIEKLQLELTIPDDHRLLSPDEIRIYEETKEKVVELESINKKLLQEKQIFQEELEKHTELKDKVANTFTDQLKKQIEFLNLQITDLQNKEQIITTQLADNETFYQQQIKEYQSKIDQITKEKQSHEERVNDLLNELEQHKENIVPDLEKQCQILKSELQNRVNTVLNEREIYYEQQIKEYQDSINQAACETEKIREELKQIQEEHNLKEEKTNALINELKQNYEKVQIEVNDQERRVDRTLSQCESNYEQKIKEYENNLNQATYETQNIQAELAKFEEEKILHDNKSNNIINSLKQDYERQYESLKNQLIELQDQDRTQNIILNERIANYEIEIKVYQTKIVQDADEIESLLDELKSLQEEKTTHEQYYNKTIDILKRNYQELQTEIEELNQRELNAHKTLRQREGQFEQIINEYEEKLQQNDRTTQHLQSELEKLQEKTKAELQDRDRSKNTALKEYETQYESQIKEHLANRDQSLFKIQDLQSKLRNLQEEKTTMENQFNGTINTLKQDFEKQELKMKTLHQRQVQFERLIKEYEDKLEQADLTTQHLQSELEKIEEEKSNFNDTISTLTQDLEILKAELQDQDQTENTALKEYEAQYQSQIKEYIANRDQSLLEIQDLQSKLTNLQEEKTTMENEFNETINILKQDNEKLQNEQKQNEKIILKQVQSQYEHEIDEYQKNLELSVHQTENIRLELANLQEEKESNEKILNDKINSLKADFENQIQILKTQIIELQNLNETEEQQSKEYQLGFAETNKLRQQVENLTRINKKFQEEIEDLKNENNPTEIDQLIQQIDNLHQMHLNLLEKQAIKEHEYDEEKKAQGKIFKNKIHEYEMKIALMKSEYMVERENIKLDHEREIIRLREQIPKLPPTKGKK